MPGSLDELTVEQGWAYLQDRFGVDRDAVDAELVERNGELWFRTGEPDERLQVVMHGFRALRPHPKGIKPTTDMLQVFGEQITENRIELSRDELDAVLAGELVTKYGDYGYVALVYEGLVVGCGLYKDGVVSSRVPKGKGEQLRAFLQ